ncbi:MAG: murein biosynthesis integral membrane protein MurJ [Polyangiales bacterium]|nr:murein biosynthesis integral membrane protein MurJ [Myxococcales bacterium]
MSQGADEPQKGDSQRELARRAGVVTVGTLASRVLGLVRDQVIAAVFPVALTDAFVVAFTIPNALRGLLAEGAVSGAFVPVFTEEQELRGREAARSYFGRFTGSMVVILATVTAVGMYFAPEIVALYADGFDPERKALTETLTRWMFPYIFFMGVAALFGGALNALHRFAVPAFAPALLNVALVAAAFAAVPVARHYGASPILALAWGVLLGGVLQVAAQKPALIHAGFLPMPVPAFRDAAVRKSFALMVPLLAGLGVYQLNVLLSRRLASHLGEGAQSYLYFAQRLVELPQGLFAFAVATATLPTLSAFRAKGDRDGVSRSFGDSLRLSTFVGVPSSAFLFIAAGPTVSVLFERGSFGALEVTETAKALVCFAPSIWIVSLVRTTLPLFYAANDTRSPVIASAVNLVAFLAVGVSFLDSLGHVGIALANSVASAAQLAALAFLGRRHVGREAFRGFGRSTGVATLASAALALAFLGTRVAGAAAGLHASRAGQVGVYVVATVAAALAFLGTAKLLRSAELDALVSMVARRRRGAR